MYTDHIPETACLLVGSSPRVGGSQHHHSSAVLGAERMCPEKLLRTF